MKAVTPYLFFKGNCREAMNFYKKVFGGELQMMTYGEAPPEAQPKVNARDRIMHGFLKNGEFVLMASDTPDDDLDMGDNIQLSAECESRQQMESYFEALSQGGEVFMAPHDTFWGARFAMLKDRFGFSWMVSYRLPDQKKG